MDTIFDQTNGEQIGFTVGDLVYGMSACPFFEPGNQFAEKPEPLFKRDGIKLLHPKTGQVICYLSPAGLANTPGHEMEGDASRYFEGK
jgi:hypothetical protein